MPTPRSVLFLKDFRGPSGGHLKIWHYFEYLDRDPRFRPVVRLSRKSVATRNPWASLSEEYRVGRRFDPDVLLLDGDEWRRVGRHRRNHPRQPVVHVIQGLRHTFPKDRRYPFLVHPAIRICVSPEVAEAVAATGRARGPIITIPAATDLAPNTGGARPVDVLVAAAKAPELGRRIAARLQTNARNVQLLDTYVPRKVFLEQLSAARVAVVLPLRREGCFLPALESMALGALTVCPDCVGNRSFCLDGVTCYRPDYDEEAIVVAAGQALAADPGPMQRQAAEMVASRQRQSECTAVLDVFERIDELWGEVSLA